MAKALPELREEYLAKAKQLHEIFNGRAVEDIPEAEAKEIKPRNDELTELHVEIERLQGLEDGKKAAAAAANGGRGEGAPRQPSKQEGEAEHKTLRQSLDDSEEYKTFRQKRKGTAIIELDPIESKTLLTLTDLNAQATRAPGVPVQKPVETATVRDMMLPGTIDGNTWEYYEETTFTNAGAEVAEGGTKPESALGFTLRTENVRKIATWIPATDEILNDVSGMESYIRGRLGFMVKRREETQLLVGDGIAPNLKGILNRSGIQTQAKGTDPTPDAVYKAMVLIMVNAFEDPTGVVMHPLDWQDIRLLRTADGIYIWGSPADPGPDRIWGLPVRKTTAMTQNTGLVGAFNLAQVFQREGITLTISTEHSTYFIENKVAILAEERLLLAVYKGNAFATVTGI